MAVFALAITHSYAAFQSHPPHCLYPDNNAYRAFPGAGRVLFSLGWHSSIIETVEEGSILSQLYGYFPAVRSLLPEHIFVWVPLLIPICTSLLF
jgi:hypothetical protein